MQICFLAFRGRWRLAVFCTCEPTGYTVRSWPCSAHWISLAHLKPKGGHLHSPSPAVQCPVVISRSGPSWVGRLLFLVSYLTLRKTRHVLTVLSKTPEFLRQWDMKSDSFPASLLPKLILTLPHVCAFTRKWPRPSTVSSPTIQSLCSRVCPTCHRVVAGSSLSWRAAPQGSGSAALGLGPPGRPHLRLGRLWALPVRLGANSSLFPESLWLSLNLFVCFLLLTWHLKNPNTELYKIKGRVSLPKKKVSHYPIPWAEQSSPLNVSPSVISNAQRSVYAGTCMHFIVIFFNPGSLWTLPHPKSSSLFVIYILHSTV